jgi:hypothetical protein
VWKYLVARSLCEPISPPRAARIVNFLRRHRQHYLRKVTMSDAGASRVSTRSNRQQPASNSIFSVPAPIKQLFDQFPLLTYPVNELPHRAPHHRNAHVLYVFSTNEGAIRGAPSFNPACLKWQVSIHLLPHYTTQAHKVADIPKVRQDTFPNRFSK